jgi:hypothetical protein
MITRAARCIIYDADERTNLHHLCCMPDLPHRLREWRSEFGTRLRAIREERGLSQEALAALAGVDRQLIYRTGLLHDQVTGGHAA